MKSVIHKRKLQDFAGSSVVHMVGGISAFVGAWAMGPRIGRFDNHTGKPIEIRGHSIPFASLGGFILVFGFFAFNGSSQGSISNPGDGSAIAVAVTNSVLAASGGAFTTMLMNKTKFFGDQKWSYLTALNGCLTGMVAICAGCNQFRTYIAFITGILGGVSYMCFTWLVLKLRIDDPLDAAAVHFGGGFVGVLSVPFFSHRYGIVYHWNLKSAYHLAWQLAGGASIFAWVATLSFILFFSLKKLHILRVPFEYELKGLDIPKHGETAYPSEAYGHGWGEKGDTLVGLVRDATKTCLKVMGPNEVRINIAERARPGESPEVDAIRNTKNGQVNKGFNRSDDDAATCGPMTSHL
ncbi:hypothetical protein DPMN_007416 [Dreissena polymorpha]|uniref:Ammonium transporter AmtB-like domain-containing protein n=1 Tax=Dreissena polymorpha TaxID=45954 RepID=A0A9D4MXB6_DREPO|nr:hypothetical protein DPMN_007416 [Dreissena polymorpha]